MMIPAVEQLDQFSRDDLLSLVKRLMQIIDQQQKRIAGLETEIAKFRQPPPTSKNSPQPPSRDQNRYLTHIQTILTTAKHKGECVFESLVKLMGTPVLPSLEDSSP